MPFVKVENGWIVLVKLVGWCPRVLTLVVSFPPDPKLHRAFPPFPTDPSIDNMINFVFFFFKLALGFLLCRGYRCRCRLMTLARVHSARMALVAEGHVLTLFRLEDDASR